jgi:1-acyl-sn-glycerol-3-phosphate acyltransferase
MNRQLRALGRSYKGIGIVAGLLWDVYIKKTPDEDMNQVSKKFYNDLADLLGIKIVFNAASAPFEEKYPTLFVGNHGSIADFIVFGSALKGTFAGKELPLPARLLKGANYIGIPRVNKDHPDFKKNVLKTLGRILQNLNHKINTIFFPEGTTTDGSIVALFRAALFKGFYKEKGLDKDGNDVGLETEARVQPIAIKVLDVEGKNVDMRPELRHYYSHYTTDNALKRIWTRLATESITIELTVFPSMNPADYKSAEDLANTASRLIRQVVAPNQTVVEKAKIPGVAERGETNPSKPPAYKY